MTVTKRIRNRLQQDNLLWAKPLKHEGKITCGIYGGFGQDGSEVSHFPEHMIGRVKEAD